MEAKEILREGAASLNVSGAVKVVTLCASAGESKGEAVVEPGGRVSASHLFR